MIVSKNNIALEKRIDLPAEEKDFHRTLLRVFSYDDKEVKLVIPGWDTNDIISYPIKQFPSAFLKNLSKNHRFFAKANIGADSRNDLYIDMSSYEKAEEPTGEFTKYLNE